MTGTRETVPEVECIHSATDVAIALGVTNAAVSAWTRDRDDVPLPRYKTRTGHNWRYFWNDAGLLRWKKWLELRKVTDPYWRDNR